MEASSPADPCGTQAASIHDPPRHPSDRSRWRPHPVTPVPPHAPAPEIHAPDQRVTAVGSCRPHGWGKGGMRRQAHGVRDVPGSVIRQWGLRVSRHR
jgi:hypothetical protein